MVVRTCCHSQSSHRGIPMGRSQGLPAGHPAPPTRGDWNMSQTETLDAIETLRTRQQATWASGDYARIGVTLQIVGETLCEAMDLRAGSRVLDVAAGNGNATLAAARRFCDVVS